MSSESNLEEMSSSSFGGIADRFFKIMFKMNAIK